MGSGKNLIFCFSQTGNTRKVAEALGRGFETSGWESEIVTIPTPYQYRADEAQAIGIGAPVHYWTVPIPVARWVEKLPAGGGKPVYVFTTYGHVYGGNALYDLARALEKKGYRSIGGVQVPAEHNYPTLRGVSMDYGKGMPDDATLAKIEEFGGRLAGKAGESGEGIKLDDFHNHRSFLNFLDSMVPIKSKINSMPEIIFRRESCIGCGTCMRLCPLQGIQIVGGRALRGKECIKCWQCVENCKGKALEVTYEPGERLIRLARRMASVPTHEAWFVE